MKARQFLVSSRVVCIIFRWNCFKRKETLFYQTQEVLSFNLASCSFPDLTWQKRIPACLSLFHLLNLAFCSLDKREFCTIDIGNSPNIGKTVSGRSCKMSQAPSPTINYRHQANVHLKTLEITEKWRNLPQTHSQTEEADIGVSWKQKIKGQENL